MFLVGGGILSHNIDVLHHLSLMVQQAAPAFAVIISLLVDGITGLIAGMIIVALAALVLRWRNH